MNRYLRNVTHLKSEDLHLHHLHLESLRLLRSGSTRAERILVIGNPPGCRGLLVRESWAVDSRRHGSMLHPIGTNVDILNVGHLVLLLVLKVVLMNTRCKARGIKGTAWSCRVGNGCRTDTASAETSEEVSTGVWLSSGHR